MPADMLSSLPSCFAKVGDNPGCSQTVTPSCRHRLGVFPLHRLPTQETGPRFKIVLFSNKINRSTTVYLFQNSKQTPERGEKVICWDQQSLLLEALYHPSHQISPQHTPGKANQTCLQVVFSTRYLPALADGHSIRLPPPPWAAS